MTEFNNGRPSSPNFEFMHPLLLSLLCSPSFKSLADILPFIPSFQRCSPPSLVLSLSPGLGPDGLPSPGGYPGLTPASTPNGQGARSSPFNNDIVLQQLAMRSSTGKRRMRFCYAQLTKYATRVILFLQTSPGCSPRGSGLPLAPRSRT